MHGIISKTACQSLRCSDVVVFCPLPNLGWWEKACGNRWKPTVAKPTPSWKYWSQIAPIKSRSRSSAWAKYTTPTISLSYGPLKDVSESISSQPAWDKGGVKTHIAWAQVFNCRGEGLLHYKWSLNVRCSGQESQMTLSYRCWLRFYNQIEATNPSGTLIPSEPLLLLGTFYLLHLPSSFFLIFKQNLSLKITVPRSAFWKDAEGAVPFNLLKAVNPISFYLLHLMGMCL